MISLSNFSKAFITLCICTQGSMAVWGAIMAPVLIGGAALSIDVSRIYNLDHDLQSGADALARAGAAELDRRNDSIARSNRAINTLVSNGQKFGNLGPGQVAVDSIRYLKTLPANDYDPVTAAMVTTDASEAQYVEISISPVTVDVLFPSSVVNAFSSATLDAKSVAGYSQGICGAAPIFVCNPFEGTNTSIYAAMHYRDFRRRLVRFKTSGGGNSQYGPGNYGFLDVGGGGASALRDAMAVDVPDICLSSTSGVTTKPGNVASVHQGFNTRFDIYNGSFNSKKNDAAYAPAANVTKGYSYTGNACNGAPNPLAFGLPKDDCFLTNSCPHMDGRMGGGAWDFVSYVEINHNAASQLNIAGTTYTFDYISHTVTPANIPTRYEVYRWEIDNNSIPGAVSYGTSITPEEGTPQCHTNGASTAPVDRRILYAAVLNCNAIEQNGGFSGRSGPHPVETFVKVFVTLPMGQGNDSSIYGEIVGPVIEGEDQGSRDQVALTR